MAQRTHSFTTRQKMAKNTFEIYHYKDSAPREVALHHHDFYEVYYFLSGSVSYNVESHSYRLTPGDLLLIGPQELHQPVFNPENREYERIVLWINSSFLQQFRDEEHTLINCFDTTLQGHSNLLRLDGANRELLHYLLQQLLQEQEHPDFASELYSLSLLTQMLVLMNRTYLRAAQGAEPRGQADSVVYRVLSYINDHYNEDLSLDELANRFFISKYHLSREFGRLVGTSVYRYIIQKRLIMARQMMSMGVPTAQVYQQCGFGDYSNFYRAFKAEYQISPRAYLEDLKRENSQRPESIAFREFMGK